jgi:putative ABC transport system permease protein
VVLLVGSALFLASFARVIDVDLGLDHRDVLTLQVRVLQVPTDPQQFSERNRQLLFNVLARVRGMPDVETAALVGGGLPLRGDLRTVNLGIPGRVLPDGTDIALNQISTDYFRVIKVPLRNGRFFMETDVRTSEPVVILNEAAATQYFPGQDAIGQVVRLLGTRTVVGVVGNVRHDGPESGVRTQAFVPITQSPVAGATLVVRTTPGARGVLPAVRQAVWDEFPDAVAPAHIVEHALGRYFDGLVAQRRLNMLLLALFGLLGLLIAAVGIYGMLSYVVMQRTPEIGVRMALGAFPSSILVSVVGGAMMYLAAGRALGLTTAWALASFVRGFLFDIQPHDPAVYAAVCGVLTLAGLAAAYWPARRAVRVDPLVALRMD